MSVWVVGSNGNGYGIDADRAKATRIARGHSASWVDSASLQFEAFEFADDAEPEVNMMGGIRAKSAPLSEWVKAPGGRWKERR